MHLAIDLTCMLFDMNMVMHFAFNFQA
eukprot:COSAG02_NODE_5834_length_4002_cov_6.388932_4_plen_26_part_01